MASSSHPKNPENEVVDTLKRQGSLRRVLPSRSTNGEPVIGLSAKMIERPRLSNASPNSTKPYDPFFQEYNLIAEYNLLASHRLPGLYVMPSATSALLWFCVVFVRKGLYEGGIFRFNLLIPEDFPNSSCPRVIFESRVFHPSVDEDSGEVEMKSAFPEWRKEVNRLWQVLEHVVQMFCSVDVKNVLNTNAAQMFESSQEEFLERVKECVDLSRTAIYNPPVVDDAHYIIFDRYNQDIHGKVLADLTEHKDTPRKQKNRGLSWLHPGSLEPFSAAQT